MASRRKTIPTVFGTVPSAEWHLDILDEARKLRLLSTPFQSIVDGIVRDAVLEIYPPDLDQQCRRLARVIIELKLPRETVDLFHNGSSGYRAQFYLGIDQGVRADRYCIDALMGKVHDLCAQGNHADLSREFIEASLRHNEAKVWIQEDGWWLDRKAADDKLIVDRWTQNSQKCRECPDIMAKWATLTPANVTVLECKGGFVDSLGAPIDRHHKPHRSEQIRDCGYT
jgi:hypothetical protein